MKILNLVNPEQSEIKWKPSKFPDGQQQITIEKYSPDVEIWGDSPDTMGMKPIYNNQVQIKSRLNNWLDLELIYCAVASLRELGVKEIHLYVPYILGARSDRKFEEGSNNYLKDVICPVINLLKLDSVTCIDPHSNCLEMGIKNFKKIDNEKLVRWAITGSRETTKDSINPETDDTLNDFILVSPDAGASHKIYKLAEQIGYKGDIITCSKERDDNGKLTLVNVPLRYNQFKNGNDIIIIDDICDGGATFINIAKEIKIKDINNKAKIYLIVTHGIFSKGFNELAQYFDGIYCTNSYSELSKDWKYTDAGVGELVKQLNIF